MSPFPVHLKSPHKETRLEVTPSMARRILDALADGVTRIEVKRRFSITEKQLRQVTGVRP